MKPLRETAARLARMADEHTQGHLPDPDEIALVVRQLTVLAEDLKGGLYDEA